MPCDKPIIAWRHRAIWDIFFSLFLFSIYCTRATRSCNIVKTKITRKIYPILHSAEGGQLIREAGGALFTLREAGGAPFSYKGGGIINDKGGVLFRIQKKIRTVFYVSRKGGGRGGKKP